MARRARGSWHGVVTASGFPADQVISALQKEIRRGRVENAALLAHEMLATGPRLEDFLWKRLLVVAVEDVGFGDPTAVVVVEALHRGLAVLPRGSGERLLFAVHAVRLLARAPKDRASDEMTHWLREGVVTGRLRPEIPDYALDMHTEAGRSKGRGAAHFWSEGTRLSPEHPVRDRTYRARIDELLSRGETASLEHRPSRVHGGRAKRRRSDS